MSHVPAVVETLQVFMSMSTLTVLISHRWLHIFFKPSYKEIQFKYTFGPNSHPLRLSGDMNSLVKRYRVL